jgi:hypothetical protein
LNTNISSNILISNSNKVSIYKSEANGCITSLNNTEEIKNIPSNENISENLQLEG